MAERMNNLTGKEWLQNSFSIWREIRKTAEEKALKHPAMFPDEIVILPILQTTKPNDLVLDTFHGSGTTGRVSNQYGRRYVGYDLKVY